MQYTGKDLNKTLWVKREESEKYRNWYKVDASWKVLWRLAVDIAKKLLGKHKAHYCDFWDVGDFVVVENVDKIRVTWNNKLLQKMYYTHSGYKWNIKSINLLDLLKKDPEKVLFLAVRWMLTKNKLRSHRMKRLKLTKGTTTKYDHFKPVNLYND